MMKTYFTTNAELKINHTVVGTKNCSYGANLEEKIYK